MKKAMIVWAGFFCASRRLAQSHAMGVEAQIIPEPVFLKMESGHFQVVGFPLYVIQITALLIRQKCFVGMLNLFTGYHFKAEKDDETR